MVLAALVLLAQTSPITFQSEALPLKKLLPQLSKLTGMPLVASPEVEWQVIYVRVKDVNAGDLLKQIAKVTFGAWETTSDGRQLLKRDAGAFSKMAEDARRERLTALETSLKAVFDPKNKAGETQLVLGRIAQMIGLGTLASIGDNQRLVYSSNPTQMQRGLPPIDASLLQQLVLSHNKQVDKQAARGTTDNDEEMKKFEAQMPPELLKMMKEMEESMKPKRIDGTPAKVDVAFANQYGISATLKMYDAKGDELASFQTSFSEGDEDEEVMSGPSGFASATTAVALPAKGGRDQDSEGKKPEPDKSPVIKLSKEATEMFGLTFFEEGDMNMMAMRGRGSSEEMKKRVAAIGEKDPFLSAQTELLNGYAENVKDNLVINVTDDLMDYREGKQITVNAVETELGPEKKDGWSISFPDEYEPRVDRDLMVTAVAKVKTGSELTIDDKAWLAGNEDRLGGASNRLMEKIYQVFGVSGYNWHNKPLLKLYGMMSQSQRNAAMDKGLPLNSLNAEQRRLVEKVCYGAELYVKPYGSQNDFDEEVIFSMDFEEAMRRQMSMMNTSEDYLNEPTESMPQGVPNGGVLTLSRKTDPVLLPVVKAAGMDMMDFMGEMGGVTVDMLAGMMSMGEMMGQPEITGMMPTQVKHATRDTLKMKLVCTDKVGYEESHRSAKADTSGKITKITDLPDFADKLAKRKEAMKKWKPMFDMGMGFGRRGSPPPL